MKQTVTFAIEGLFQPLQEFYKENEKVLILFRSLFS